MWNSQIFHPELGDDGLEANKDGSCGKGKSCGVEAGGGLNQTGYLCRTIYHRVPQLLSLKLRLMLPFLRGVRLAAELNNFEYLVSLFPPTFSILPFDSTLLNSAQK